MLKLPRSPWILDRNDKSELISILDEVFVGGFFSLMGNNIGVPGCLSIADVNG